MAHVYAREIDMIWKDFATPEEMAELARLDQEKEDAKLYRRQIYQRCRKRMERANGQHKELAS